MSTGMERDAAAVSPIEPTPRLAPGRSLRKRRSPWPVRIAILLALLVAGGLLIRGARKKPLAVEAAAVERGMVRDEISSSAAGEVMAERKATVRAELSGRVLAVKHRRGERVRRGEVVVALDAADLEARSQQAQATLAAQRAQLAQAEAHAEAAQRTAERERRLAEHGAETAKMAEDAAAQAREAQAAVEVARGQLAQSAAALQVARVARSHAELTAAFDGLLADVFVDPGDEVQIGGTIFELVDDARLHVEATIDEADIGRVKVGQPATLRLDALPDHPIAGVVSKLDPTVRKDEKGARTLRLEVEVSDLPRAVAAGVRPGMSANVDVRVAEKDDVLSLPTNVIIGRGTKRSVFLIDQGVARERSIQIGMSSWERTEIASGLAQGDRVVANLNAKGLVDGAAVLPTGERAR
ncbi:MAG TPA: efflux RND transporter periplasmic adaptor subunit [Anaeromyxobacteraceae bacterium]